MPTFDHDWEDAEFKLSDYRHGCRLGQSGQGDEPKPSAEQSQPIPPAPRKIVESYGMEDPSSDPALFAVYDEAEPLEVNEGECFKRALCA